MDNDVEKKIRLLLIILFFSSLTQIVGAVSDGTTNSELGDFLILEDIGDYVFIGEDNIGREFDAFINDLTRYGNTEFHMADYSKNDKQISMVIVKFNSQDDALDYLIAYSLDDYFEFEDQNIYYQDGGEVIVSWVSGNYFILMDETPIAWEIISAYLEKFQSDLKTINILWVTGIATLLLLILVLIVIIVKSRH